MYTFSALMHETIELQKISRTFPTQEYIHNKSVSVIKARWITLFCREPEPQVKLRI